MNITHDTPYEEYLATYFNERLPDRIYDGHFHIRGDRYLEAGITDGTYAPYVKFAKETLGENRLSGGLVMPPASVFENLERDNAYNIALAEREGYDAGLLIAPENTREEVEGQLDVHPCIRALKPYPSYVPAEKKFSSDMLAFAPEWIFALANERELPVIIHLSHYNNMLYERANHEQVRYVAEKYPRMKLILAHCAMGHHIGKLKLGLPHIMGLKNIWFDCSGSTEALSIHACLKAFGTDRMIFGTDYNHGASLGRICSFGSNFIGFHTELINEAAIPPDYLYQPLNNTTEGMVALFDAGDLLSLGDKDYEKIFYSTAREVFGY